MATFKEFIPKSAGGMDKDKSDSMTPDTNTVNQSSTYSTRKEYAISSRI